MPTINGDLLEATQDDLGDGTTNKAYTATEKTKLAGVETLADVTDAANVAAATAVMDGDFSTDGLMARTGAGAYASRTITGTANRVTVTNGDGDAGNPTLDVGSDVTTNAGTVTLTNKRITRRVVSTTSTATLTIDSDSYDGAVVSAQAATLAVAAPTGTPTDMQPLIIRIKDNGTIRTINWNAAFAPQGNTLPTTTVASKTHTIGCQWDTVASKWNVLAITAEA